MFRSSKLFLFDPLPFVPHELPPSHSPVSFFHGSTPPLQPAPSPLSLSLCATPQEQQLQHHLTQASAAAARAAHARAAAQPRTWRGHAPSAPRLAADLAVKKKFKHAWIRLISIWCARLSFILFRLSTPFSDLLRRPGATTLGPPLFPQKGACIKWNMPSRPLDTLVSASAFWRPMASFWAWRRKSPASC